MLFTHEFVTDRIVRIRDLSYTAMYLVFGDDKTVLLDTGIGIGNVKEYINEQFKKDVDYVILTHGHLDHASGAILFKDLPIYMHANDLSLMNKHVFNKENRIQYTLNALSHFKKGKAAFKDEDILDGLDSSYTIPLNDNDEFDLGGITLKAIHTPGHTQGMCMILFKEERIILFGDGCGVGVLLVEECCSTVEEYRKTLLKVKTYEDQYDRIIRNHGTCESPKELLDNVIDVCSDILEGKDDHIPANAPIKCDYPCFMAKATVSNSQSRVDGKEGNIIYASNKIR